MASAMTAPLCSLLLVVLLSGLLHAHPPLPLAPAAFATALAVTDSSRSSSSSSSRSNSNVNGMSLERQIVSGTTKSLPSQASPSSLAFSPRSILSAIQRSTRNLLSCLLPLPRRSLSTFKPRPGLPAPPSRPSTQPPPPPSPPVIRNVDCPYTNFGRGENLYKCAMGYAGLRGVTGGRGKPLYVVTTSADNLDAPLPGMLRYGLMEYTEGARIIFSRSMDILLWERVFVPSNTTIDGRGVRVRIFRHSVVVENAENVIIHNIEVGNTIGDYDAIPIRGSRRVWVDHCKVYNALRGVIDVVYNSTLVTISNNYLSNNNLTMLLGASDTDTRDKNLRVTVYRNWFYKSGQRQPACRWGMFHVVNNVYSDWGFYAIGGRVYARILSEANVFTAGRRAEVTPWYGPQSLQNKDFDYTSTIRSKNDLFLNGATFHEYPGTLPLLAIPYSLQVRQATRHLQSFVMTNAGPKLLGNPR